jgi:hypothetical protein
MLARFLLTEILFKSNAYIVCLPASALGTSRFHTKHEMGSKHVQESAGSLRYGVMISVISYSAKGAIDTVNSWHNYLPFDILF